MGFCSYNQRDAAEGKNSMAYLERSAGASANPFNSTVPERERAALKAGVWKAEVFENYKTFKTMWRRMESEGHCTVFQTYDWVSSWYDAAASCGEAKPLVVAVSKEEADPVWILPLCLYRRKGIRIVSFADLGVTDYAAPVIAREAPANQNAVEAIIHTVLNALPPCDLIHFQKMPETVDGVPNPLLHLRGLLRFPEDCHGIRLNEPWPALAEKNVRPRIRSSIRRRKKLMHKEGEVSVELYDSPETLGPLMDKIIAMRNERFEAIGKPVMPPLWQKFYQTLVARQDRVLNASITTLSVSGQAISFSFGLTRDKTYHDLLATFDMGGQWQKFSPGILLTDAMLTNFAEQVNTEGYFDLTVGDEPYKQIFGSESHPLYEWIAPRSVAGIAAYTAWRGKAFLRRNPRLFEILKKVKQATAGGH